MGDGPSAAGDGHLPAHLPRIEQVIEPDSILCPCGCGAMQKVGESRIERLDVTPGASPAERYCRALLRGDGATAGAILRDALGGLP